MSEFKKDLSKIFKSSRIFTEQKKTEINEKLWDDIKGEWNKGKEIAKAPIKNLGKNLRDTIASRLFNKKEPKALRVSGTGTSAPKPEPVKAKDPQDDPNKTINIPPKEFNGEVKSDAKPKETPALVNPEAPKPEPVKAKESPKNDDAMIIDPKSGRNIVHPDKPVVILYPQGIELQGVEDANQKEKKIVNPIKTILQKKNSEFTNTFEKMKQKNGISSKNSTDEISQKDPTDPIRKSVIKDIFAIKFYNDAYKGLLKNLRDMNIISENKLDYGTFQQAINNALETANEIHNRRYKLKLKKINSLNKNEKDAKLGLRKGKDMFSKDMNSIYKSNKDKFTQPLLQEGVKYFEGFLKEEYINEEEPKVADKKEDKVIRANDYVWWLDETELANIMKDDAKKKLLTYKNIPIEFQDSGNGQVVDDTTAQIRFLGGAQKGESEKIDIRNIDIPQKLAKDLVQFGKVLSNTSDLDQKIADVEAQLKTPNISNQTKADNQKELDRLNKEKEKAGSVGSMAKIQKFIAKDKNSLEKTIAGGNTKITPDPSNQIVDVHTKNLVKLNKEGKKSLLKIIGVTSIVLHSVLNLLSGESISKFLHGINDALAKVAKNFGDMAGSKSETNF